MTLNDNEVLLKEPGTMNSWNVGLFSYQGSGLSKVYFPVNFKTKDYPTSGDLIIKLTSPKEVKYVEWLISSETKSKSQEEYTLLRDGEAYPSYEPIIIKLSENLDKGVYTLKLKAYSGANPDPEYEIFKIHL